MGGFRCTPDFQVCRGYSTQEGASLVNEDAVGVDLASLPHLAPQVARRRRLQSPPNIYHTSPRLLIFFVYMIYMS